MTVFTKANFPFIQIRRWAYLLISVTIVLCLGSLAIKGSKYSIDFLGGTLLELHFDRPVEIEEVRSALGQVEIPDVDLATSEIKYVGAGSQDVLIRVVQVGQRTDTSALVKESLAANLGDRIPSDRTEWILREEMVGPTIGAELKEQALWAIFFSVIMMLVYIGIRFDYKFSVGAILSTVHDVIMTLGIFSLLDKEISLTIVAAVLTIVGFSVNDTIVIFDRIREKLRRGGKAGYAEILNVAINETLSRTFITSFTVFLTVMAIFLFGGTVINDFAFAMLIGIITGVYSTIFVATPVVVEFHNMMERRKAREASALRAKVPALSK
jgi:preprotein translocase SecF subunit